MNSEAEKNAYELCEIRLHPTVMMNIQLSQAVLTPEFYHEFKLIPKKTCKDCGETYRVTHRCDIKGTEIWIPNWEAILLEKFKLETEESLDITLEAIEIPEEEEIDKKIHDIELEKPIQLVIPHEEKKSIPQNRQTAPNQSLITVTNLPSVSEPQIIPEQNMRGPSKGTLMFSSYSQLTSKERIVYEQLKNWRNVQANRERIEPFDVVPDAQLLSIVYFRVANTNELMQISGITPKVAYKYGTEIMRIMIRNGMATGIKTHQQQRKQSTFEKVVSKDDTNNKKILAGFICCFVIVVFIIIISVF